MCISCGKWQVLCARDETWLEGLKFIYMCEVLAWRKCAAACLSTERCWLWGNCVFYTHTLTSLCYPTHSWNFMLKIFKCIFPVSSVLLQSNSRLLFLFTMFWGLSYPLVCETLLETMNAKSPFLRIVLCSNRYVVQHVVCRCCCHISARLSLLEKWNFYCCGVISR
jgi:hypothetical protein